MHSPCSVNTGSGIIPVERFLTVQKTLVYPQVPFLAHWRGLLWLPLGHSHQFPQKARRQSLQRFSSAPFFSKQTGHVCTWPFCLWDWHSKGSGRDVTTDWGMEVSCTCTCLDVEPCVFAPTGCKMLRRSLEDVLWLWADTELWMKQHVVTYLVTGKKTSTANKESMVATVVNPWVPYPIVVLHPVIWVFLMKSRRKVEEGNTASKRSINKKMRLSLPPSPSRLPNNFALKCFNPARTLPAFEKCYSLSTCPHGQVQHLRWKYEFGNWWW